MGFMFAGLELAHRDDVGPLEAIVNSWRLVQGQRLKIILFGMTYIPVAIIGLLALCVGAIPAAAFSELAFVALYLALRRGDYGEGNNGRRMNSRRSSISDSTPKPRRS